MPAPASRAERAGRSSGSAGRNASAPKRARGARAPPGRAGRGRRADAPAGPECLGAEEDLVARLLAEPGVALVAAESGEGEVLAADAKGEAAIERRNGTIRYTPRTGDPLGVGGAFAGTHREWLARSWSDPFPDAAYQLLDQFRAGRTGDLVVVANEGYDFRGRFEIPEHRSGHGSLIRAHMHTPLWSNRPLGTVPLRTIDLFPTMLDWLGVTPPSAIDGELVWRA